VVNRDRIVVAVVKVVVVMVAVVKGIVVELRGGED